MRVRGNPAVADLISFVLIGVNVIKHGVSVHRSPALNAIVCHAWEFPRIIYSVIYIFQNFSPLIYVAVSDLNPGWHPKSYQCISFGESKGLFVAMLPIQSDSPTKRHQTRHPYLAVLGLPAGEAVRLALHWDVLVTGQRAVTLVAAEVLQVPESVLRACAVHHCMKLRHHFLILPWSHIWRWRLFC